MSVRPRKGSPYLWYSFTWGGVRFRGSTGTADPRKARLAEAEALAAAKEKRTYKDAWRLRDAFGAYWDEHAKHQRSADFVFHKLEQLSRLLGKDTLITDLTNAKLLDYRAKRRGEGLAANTVNRDLAILKAALNHARQMHGKPTAELAWKRLRADEPPHRIRFLSHKEYTALLAACDADLARAVTFAVATGLRKANVVGLTWNQVDLARGAIVVPVKGGKLHTVKMTPQLRAMLGRTRLRKGRVFDTTNFRKRWEKAVKDAGLDDFRFHDLRHTFASWARMAGADIADICDALGHSSTAVTMRYAHIEPTQHISAFDRVASGVWSQSVTHDTPKVMKTKQKRKA